jgi:hypothetical protein
MNKSIHFSGQPTFSQLIKLIPKSLVKKCITSSCSDHYYKKFDTWHHLISMLFTCFGHCHSLREVVTGMRAFEGKLQGSGVNYFPARSTFAEANLKRDSKVFEQIYFALKQYWDGFSPDSQKKNERIYIIDSTTIKLFQEIFKGSGCGKQNGKRKGGLKVHMAVQDPQCMPSLVRITQAACNDGTFTKYLNLPADSTVVMDRGYRNYKQYAHWTTQQVRWVTRSHPNSYYVELESLAVPIDQIGVEHDSRVRLGHPAKKNNKITCRLIRYISPSKKRFEFLTNDFKSDALTIANLYKRRWSIETLFKRLKQNMPLQYFLGDNQNAIRIQIWCALIADLLLQVVRNQVPRKWAFSNIVSLLRLHLFNYLDLYSFLKNPDKCSISITTNPSQTHLNFSG